MDLEVDPPDRQGGVGAGAGAQTVAVESTGDPVGTPRLDGSVPGRRGNRDLGRRKRSARNLLPFGGGGRLLRFRGRARVNSGQPSHVHDDELYMAIGRVAANWSLLEVVSGLVLMGLIGRRDETLARAVVAGQRVENVWDTTEALLIGYGDTAAERLDEFRGWRRSANVCRRRRNEAIHSAWSLTDSGDKPAAWDMMSQRAKQGARGDLFPGGVEELEELARDIAALEARLTEIHEGIVPPNPPPLR
jgi:hypothetical protein